MRVLAQIVLNGLGVVIAARLVPGISFDGSLLYLVVAGVVVGLINLLIRPLVVLLSLPAIVLTLGLFYLVVNGALFLLAAALLSGLEVDGCLPAVLGGLVLAAFNLVVRLFRDSTAEPER